MKILTLNGEYSKYQKEMSTELSKHTVPIFEEDYSNHLKLIGSSVFVKIGNRHFLISAAHVLLDNGYKSLFIPAGEDFNNLTNGFVSGNAIIENEDRKNDKIDISIYEIDENNRPKLCMFEPIELLTIDINHQLDNSKYRPYYAVGFPGTKTKMIKRNNVKSTCYSFASDLSDDEKYNKLNLNKHSHILIDFNRNQAMKSDKKPVTFPIPNGMSGGGLWYLPIKNILNTVFPKPKIVGILTEYVEDNIYVMMSTRIHIVLEVMRQKFNLDIPKSRITNVKLL